ncbi:MAG: shikimate dehydrogenase [Alphaproteobacteria bacterium GM7ARS4]|nr:shikimate dehydrogenase [Alphaproteobacteria bacterium GM7ARS4]
MTYAAVIGDPVSHSRSRCIFNYWLERHSIEGRYETLRVVARDLRRSVFDLQRKGYRGINVTLPHKESICSLMDDMDMVAKRIGAVNMVTFGDDGRIYGRNTDGEGFIRALERCCVGVRSHIKGKPIVVMGAGGVARAVSVSLLAYVGGDCQLRIVNRDCRRGRALIHFLGAGRFYDWDDHRCACEGAALVINGTSLGMDGGTMWEETTVDWGLIFSEVAHRCIVYDTVYVPLETSLLRSARESGLPCVDGLWMLLYQAVPACVSWFGVEPIVDEDVRRHVLSDILCGRASL